MLTALSPLDGRYVQVTKELSEYFSEYALIKYRVHIEIAYFKALIQVPLPQLADLPKDIALQLDNILANFTVEEAEQIKATEKITNHDVKAVEYYIKSKFDQLGLSQYKEFIHFGLTSQDINNTAFPLMIKDGISKVITPAIQLILNDLREKAKEYAGIPMLARTHGQPASPTTLGKEIAVFVERLED
ncbi:MAG TPA: lyase family protein, partial [Saprospiraceae bacterium]|nr:lyase family protein [Saprospiraceae bacterium]